MLILETSEPVVIFGEVLFDCFDDREVLGGAPFNVAWNLKGLARSPLFVGAVGRDEMGARVVKAMREWHMLQTGLSMCASHPTGRVQVTLDGGEPSYELAADQAFDHPDVEQNLPALPESGLLYHGSLALRHPDARAALGRLREHMDARVFMDVNLRAPWWDLESVHELMAGANWVKLNEDELKALTPDSSADIEGRAELIRARHDLEAVIVTRGAQGAMVLTGTAERHVANAPAASPMVDTVGAGDAFSAMILLGLSEGWSWPDMLEHASDYASRVCSLRGAITPDPVFYMEAKQTLVDVMDD